jgi:hypothetical protein
VTEDEVLAKVEVIRGLAGDAESAHAEEDSLHMHVLAAIADGSCVEPELCAKAALSTMLIDFPRWYA